MTRRSSTPPWRALRMSRSGADAAPSVTGCGCAALPSMPPSTASTGSPPPSPSAPIRTPSASTPSGRSWSRSSASGTCPPTSRSRTAICAPCSCRRNTASTGRITAAACAAALLVFFILPAAVPRGWQRGPDPRRGRCWSSYRRQGPRARPPCR